MPPPAWWCLLTCGSCLWPVCLKNSICPNILQLSSNWYRKCNSLFHSISIIVSPWKTPAVAASLSFLHGTNKRQMMHMDWTEGFVNSASCLMLDGACFAAFSLHACPMQNRRVQRTQPVYFNSIISDRTIALFTRTMRRTFNTFSLPPFTVCTAW